MSAILGDLPFVRIWVDNILVVSKDAESHKQHLATVIERCNKYHLRLRPDKCKIGRARLYILGHIVDEKGVRVDPNKQKKIKDWPNPKDKKQLEKFLGLCNYLRDHIPRYTQLTHTLNQLRGRASFDWKPEHTQAFEALKEACSRSFVLNYPSWNKKFCLVTDASTTGIGAVLFQPDKQGDMPNSTNIISFRSRSLDKWERSYSAYKLELLAVVYSLKQFHDFLYQTEFHLYTDHRALVFLSNTPTMNRILTNWYWIIHQYKFTVTHVPGTLNVLADMLSRIPDGTNNGTNNVTSTICAIDSPSSASAPTDDISIDTKYIEESQEPIQQEKKEPVRDNNHEREQLTFVQDQEVRARMLRDAHRLGHFGTNSVIRQIRKWGYTWKHIRSDVAKEVQSCELCQAWTNTPPLHLSLRHVHSKKPFEHIQFDLFTSMAPSNTGMTTLLVIVDVFSSFTILEPVKDKSKDEIARKIFKHICTFGPPTTIQSDNDSSFITGVLQAVTALFGVQHSFIAAYNPRADGKVERAGGIATQLLRKLCRGNYGEWDTLVPWVQFCINNKTKRRLNTSPFETVFLREPRHFTYTKFTQDTPTSPEYSEADIEEWCTKSRQIMENTFGKLEKRDEAESRKNTTNFDRRRKTFSGRNPLQEGTIVMIKDVRRNNKNEPVYIGKYTITGQDGRGNYTLKDSAGTKLNRLVTIDQMKVLPHAPKPSKDEQDQTWHVDELIDHRVMRGRHQYKVKWTGFDIEQATWEPVENIEDTNLIKQFHEKSKNISKPRPRRGH
eukprot:TRINITY_DN1372_c0_g2_i1.p1 TRINITY_DN1372_c0_g2~~TRINITY_DN1372_c0_g2_i1.p1  ORF type:complete len:829 (+),score=-144.52 TRINITY_DN1372_c0_g2_i1:148-2487(+)